MTPFLEKYSLGRLHHIVVQTDPQRPFCNSASPCYDLARYENSIRAVINMKMCQKWVNWEILGFLFAMVGHIGGTSIVCVKSMQKLSEYFLRIHVLPSVPFSL